MLPNILHHDAWSIRGTTRHPIKGSSNFLSAWNLWWKSESSSCEFLCCQPVRMTGELTVLLVLFSIQGAYATQSFVKKPALHEPHMNSKCNCKCEVRLSFNPHTWTLIFPLVQQPKIIRLEVPKLHVQYIPVVVKSKETLTWSEGWEGKERVRRSSSRKKGVLWKRARCGTHSRHLLLW